MSGDESEFVGAEVDDVEEDEVSSASSSEDDESEGEGTAVADAEPETRVVKADPLLKASNSARTLRIVAPGDRITDGRLQPLELGAVLALRAAQIAATGRVFVEATSHDPVELAYNELYARRCPLKLRRHLERGPHPVAEDWSPNEMALPPIVLGEAHMLAKNAATPAAQADVAEVKPAYKPARAKQGAKNEA